MNGADKICNEKILQLFKIQSKDFDFKPRRLMVNQLYEGCFGTSLIRSLKFRQNFALLFILTT